MTLSRKDFAALFLTFLLVFTALTADAQVNKGENDLDQKESYAYVLTMEKIHRLENVRKALGEWLKNNAQVSQRMEGDKSLTDGTTAQQARAIDTKYFEVAMIIRKQGISTVEYMLASHVLFRAFSLVAAKKQNEIRDYSDAGRGVNPDNLAFVEEHFDEIQKTMLDSIRVKA